MTCQENFRPASLHSKHATSINFGRCQKNEDGWAPSNVLLVLLICHPCGWTVVCGLEHLIWRTVDYGREYLIYKMRETNFLPREERRSFTLTLHFNFVVCDRKCSRPEILANFQPKHFHHIWSFSVFQFFGRKWPFRLNSSAFFVLCIKVNANHPFSILLHTLERNASTALTLLCI